MAEPFDVFEESPSLRRAPVSRRVDDMFEQIKSKLPGAPKFLLCLLPERKNCEVYGSSLFPVPKVIHSLAKFTLFCFNQVLGRGSVLLNSVLSHNALLHKESMISTYSICY